ncbi:MAG: S41 family peptidase [Clostridiales bacterium]|nr:S41 family peptidase [Clostridiales bacterium]
MNQRLKDAMKRLRAIGLGFCVLVTIILGVLYLMYPREWSDFLQVMVLVKRDYQEPLSIGRMLDGAIAGIAGSANDPYTYFLPPERNRAVAMSAQGLTGAIGVTVNGEKEVKDRLIIREIRPDSGADRAGLRVEDAILRIEDTLVEDLSVDEAVAMIRGEPDTAVRLLIARAGEAEKEYRVMRSSTVPVETVQAGILKDEYLPGYRIAYIFIDYFAANSAEMFSDLLDTVLEEGAQAMVIDLRYNSGGDVGATVKIAGRLLPDGELMRLNMRESEQVFTIKNADPVRIPYAILINGGSASASEILAGAVQDRQAGILVGTRSYGKGSVQSLYNLPTGSGLRVTEGRYYLPSGRSIDGEGIDPDYIVENDEEDEDDRQMSAALAFLKDIIDGAETLESILRASPRGK